MVSSVSSMTGFGRSAGADPAGRGWTWELRSVNGRGFDLRLKLPSGLDAQDATLRQLAAAALKRGSIQAALTLQADSSSGLSIRTDLLDRLLEAARDLATRIPGAPPPRAEALLALPGVLRMGTDATSDPPDPATLLAGFAEALQALVRSRQEEGGRLHAILTAQLDEIAALTTQATTAAASQPVAQQKRLRENLRALIGDIASGISEDRLAQELALLATRADVREELDRLASHISQARALLDEGGQVGRRLDFLVQEFNREANTLCSKSAATALTTIGLQLKAVIEQLREQVQNLE